MLAGNPSVTADLDQAVDMAVAFCPCRAAALFAPGQDGRLRVRARSAILRHSRRELDSILGSRRDAAPLNGLARTSCPGFSSVKDFVEESGLIPLRGVALELESLAVSVHPRDPASIGSGFAVIWWEEEKPGEGRLDRAQLAALALCAGLDSPSREAGEGVEEAAVGHSGSDDAGTTADEAQRAHSGVLRELEAMAGGETDPLEELALQSSLLSALDSAVPHAREQDSPVALILIDTDDLADINRIHGSRTGDEILRNIAAILLEEIGSEDLAVRYGMERFALLVHGDSQQVKSRAIEIQKKVKEQAMPGPEGSRCGSVSVGVGCLPDPLADDSNTLRVKAEQALDLARQQRPGGLIIL
jgi:diguanylate cyclase (GGDEF)-like protein